MMNGGDEIGKAVDVGFVQVAAGKIDEAVGPEEEVFGVFDV